MTGTLPLKLDHLTVVAPSLEEGVAFVEGELGVEAPPGGKHPRMGTHNHLLRLGDDLFLEIVAIDPDAERPKRPRWFDLDTNPDRPASLATWVLGTSDIGVSLGKATEESGRAVEITRGDLTWLISIADTSKMPLNGAFPTLIQWPKGPHPASGMAASGCSLQSLQVGHPDADVIVRFLDGSLADARVSVVDARAPFLSAEIRTPQGVRVLRSTLMS